MEPKPVGWRQLCAIAREQITAEPTIDNGEWAERIKGRLVALGLDYPHPAQLTAAMDAVERALMKIWGPRPPPPDPTHAPYLMAAHHEAPWPRQTSSSGWASIAEVIASLQGSPRSATPSAASPDPLPPATAHDYLDLSETHILGRFLRAAADLAVDRLELLRVYAEIAILRPADWDPAAVRATQHAHPLDDGGGRCWVCRSGDRKIVWHHVLQIQHGGSNTPRNRVPLCERCHSQIHPWLPATAGTPIARDFVPLAALAPVALARWRAEMMAWTVAERELRCGYDFAHVIRQGESYLDIAVKGTHRIRCRDCAGKQWQPTRTEPDAAAPAPHTPAHVHARAEGE